MEYSGGGATVDTSETPLRKDVISVSTPSTPLQEADPHNPSGKTFFGHPRMLANLFSVEMWERFSFYGMQSVLVYYLYFPVVDGGLGLDKAAATGVIGAYGGMVYLLAIVGGYLGDRILGPERTLFYAAVSIMCGHLALSLVPGLTGVVVGLVLIAIGSGCLKTNASVLVGSLYELKDMRREAGFTVFYIGVNTGALLGPLLSQFGWSLAGFHVGFALAAIGMAVGLVQYSLTRKNLPREVFGVPDPAPRNQRVAVGIAALVFVAAIALLTVFGAITPDSIDNWVIGLILVAAVAVAVNLLRSRKTTPEEHSRLLAFIPLWIGNVVFWALYQQQFTVMAVYSDERVNWNFFGFELPPGLFNSINPLFIIVFGTAFATMWTKLGNRQASTPVKFALGLIGVGAAFAVFLLPAGHHVVNIGWLVLVLFVATLAELTISPTGSSATTRLAPEQHKSTMMAWYWTSVALGTALSGWLAQFYTEGSEVGYFSTMALVSIAVGVVLWLASRPIIRLMRGVK